MDDETPITSHSLVPVIAFVPTTPPPDVCAASSTDDSVLDDPRTTNRTQSILYDGICDVVVQRMLPGPYPECRDTPVTGGGCARESMGCVL